MKIRNLIIGIILVECNLCDYLKDLAPNQSMAYINDSLVIYQPATDSQDQSLIYYSWENRDVSDLQSNNNSTKVYNDFSQLFDYRFFNTPGDLTSKRSTYMLGSIKLKNLDKGINDVNSRFSLMRINDGLATKQQWTFMTSPPITTKFPDIDYGAALVGEPDIGIPSSKASLYIMGGAKYNNLKKNLEMVKHFSLYNFTTNKWEDLSSTLPENYQQLAGHQLINIDNGKLIALGGYTTNSYTMQPNIAAVDPHSIGFDNILVYDIEEKKWESKATILSAEDLQVIGLRKIYFSTSVYKNNKLYVYAGYQPRFYGNSALHNFGILDLITWKWKWYLIELNSEIKDITSKSFDSILIGDSILVSHANNKASDKIGFFRFNLNLEDYSNLMSSSSYSLLQGNGVSESLNIRSVPIGVTVFLISLAQLVFATILFLLYRFYQNSKQSKGEGIRFETEDIWSDPSIYATRGKNLGNKHLRQYRLYQCFILQQLNTYSPLGQTFSYHEPESELAHGSNSQTRVNLRQNIYKLPDIEEDRDSYSTC